MERFFSVFGYTREFISLLRFTDRKPVNFRLRKCEFCFEFYHFLALWVKSNERLRLIQMTEESQVFLKGWVQELLEDLTEITTILIQM